MAPPNYSLILIMACFWVVFFLVRRLLVVPMGALLDERARRAQAAATAFDSARAAVSEALNRCERELAQAAAEGQRERAALRAEGESERRCRLEQAREVGQAKLHAFTRELEEAASQAREELRRATRALAAALAQRLLGRRLAS